MKPYDKIPIVDENFDDYILTNYKGKTYTVTENKFSAKVNSHGARLFKIMVK
jgi:hypothetical protein